MAPKAPRRPLPLARWTSRHPWVTRIVAAGYFANFVALAVANLRDGTRSGLFYGAFLLVATSYLCWWWVFGIPRQVTAYEKHQARAGGSGGDARPGAIAYVDGWTPLPRPKAGDD